MLSKRQFTEEVETHELSGSSLGEERVQSCEQLAESPICEINGTQLTSDEFCTTSSLAQDNSSQESSNLSVEKKTLNLGSLHTKPAPCTELKKKMKENNLHSSLWSFFNSTTTSSKVVKSSNADTSLKHTSDSAEKCEIEISKESESSKSEPDQSQCESYICNSSPADKSKVALLEWQRIQQLMQNSIPICKGHSEQCVSRVVKKAGPTCGRHFYVCALSEGPASNPEANCGYFKWADSGSKRKQGK